MMKQSNSIRRKIVAMFLAFCMTAACLPTALVMADTTSTTTGNGNKAITFSKTANWKDANHGNDNFDATIELGFRGYSETVRENAPDIIVILDSSGSMKGNPALACRSGATSFVTQYLYKFPTASVAVTSFNNTAQTAEAPYCSFSNNAATLTSMIDSIYKNGDCSGGTNYEAGFRSAASIMANAGKKNTDVAVVFFSDGEPTYSCVNGNMATHTGTGHYVNDAELYQHYNNAKNVINNYFVNGNGDRTPIFTLSYGVTNPKYLQIIQSMATQADYSFNSNDFSGTISDVFMNMFQEVLNRMMTVPITFTDYISQYFEVDTANLPHEADKTYMVSNETLNGQRVQKVTVDMNANIEVDNATATIPIKLKEEYQMPDSDVVYPTNFDRAGTPGASITYHLLRNSEVVNNTQNTLYCTTTSLDLAGANIELTFNKTKYQLAMGERRSHEPLDYTLKINGKVITDQAILSKIQFETINYGQFSNIRSLVVGEVDTNGELYAVKSGVTTISASYNGISATNSAVLIVPGDVDANGYVVVADASIVAAVLRGTTDGSRNYINELCDTNCDGEVTVADASIIAAMVRGTAGYDNSFY